MKHYIQVMVQLLAEHSLSFLLEGPSSFESPLQKQKFPSNLKIQTIIKIKLDPSCKPEDRLILELLVES